MESNAKVNEKITKKERLKDKRMKDEKERLVETNEVCIYPHCGVFCLIRLYLEASNKIIGKSHC